jgi:hypothetical protein
MPMPVVLPHWRGFWKSRVCEMSFLEDFADNMAPIALENDRLYNKAV